MTRRKDSDLRPDDQALWQSLTRDVRPLADRPPAPPLPKNSRPGQRAAPMMPVIGSGGGLAPGGIDRKRLRRLGRGHERVDSVIDLHGMTGEAAHQRLLSHLNRAVSRGERLVLVITGKGGRRFSQSEAIPAEFRRREDFGESGVLKRMAPLWLEGPDLAPLVAGFSAAHQEHGGEGALYVLLRKAKS